MSGECNYESDISESWSLIDLNLNEQQAIKVNSAQNPEESPPERLEFLSMKDSSSNLEEDESNITESSYLHTKDDVDHLSSDYEKTDSASEDGESIEILDLDANDRDVDINIIQNLIGNLDVDKPNYNQNGDGTIDNSCLAVVRKRSGRLPESILNSQLSSDSFSSTDQELNSPDCDLTVQVYKSRSSSVHGHCQNTFRNTALSLCLGVFFASVACIGIGHFLAGHDSSNMTGTTSEDLLETLKKLQLENAELQSRLSSLNAGFMRKFEMEDSFVEGDGDGEFCDRRDESETYGEKMSEDNSNPSATPQKFSSKEWLNKFQALVKDRQASSDLRKVVEYLNEQVKIVNGGCGSERGGLKGLFHLEESSAKMANVLQKVVSSLMSSQENLESLYQRLFKLKTKWNKQLNRIFGGNQGKPVREADLLTNPWTKNGRTEINREPVALYRFPQPEEYYEGGGAQEVVVEPSESKLFEEDEIVTSKNDDVETGQGGRNKRENRNVKEKQRKQSKERTKPKEKKSNKYNKYRRIEKATFDEQRKGPNETRSGTPHEETPKKPTKEESKRRPKKCKKKRSEDVENFHSCKTTGEKNWQKASRRNFARKSAEGNLSHGFTNKTGYWVFRWADGRQRIRKDQSLGDWQFDRARARRELRDEISPLEFAIRGRRLKSEKKRFFYRIFAHN